MKTAVYPGSYDPVTVGHVDIIKRSADIFDEVVIGVLDNYRKQSAFTVEERVNMLEKALAGIENVKVKAFSGLVVDFAKQEKASVIIRGLRTVTDYEFEMNMAQTNKHLADDIETLFMVADRHLGYVSSSAVRELAMFDGDYKDFVPEEILEDVQKKFRQ